MDNLDELSCTDKPCSWKRDHSKSLEQYKPVSLKENESFKFKRNKIVISDDLKKKFKNNVVKNNPESAYAKHVVGRHALITFKNQQQYNLTESAKEIISKIFQHQSTITLQTWLENISCDPLKSCCDSEYNHLKGNFISICELSRMDYKCWQRERKNRITGLRCYEIYTYTFNKTPDWVKKCSKFFNPAEFRNEYTEHGLQSESQGRIKFSKMTNETVHEVGLVISSTNPWLAHSPDGVIFENGQPNELVEIKCPYKGKKMNVFDAIKEEFKSCLNFNSENIQLKKKHKYYGQMQLGMFILNVRKSSFAIYASFDASMLIISVDFDEEFVRKMLESLKKAYFIIMIHTLCMKSCCNLT